MGKLGGKVVDAKVSFDARSGRLLGIVQREGRLVTDQPVATGSSPGLAPLRKPLLLSNGQLPIDSHAGATVRWV